MSSKVKYFYIAIVLLVCQIVLGGYLNIMPILYIAFFAQLFLLLPHAMDRGITLVYAFIYGICIDLLADGVLGLNGAALVAMAYLRTPILKLVLSRANIENNESLPLTSKYIELPKLVLISILCHLIFFSVYVLLDSAASFTLLYTVMKILLCTVVNSIISVVCNMVLFEKILK